ncbi:hypothetical protein [Xanthomarina spongicola]|uniref:Nitrite reductase/ring-hydroxylating ferredoxin subunit n=1 Tax=Xanthomarina spongicola TaxID=570520 RepID=A0A316DMZ2_9FLAO|nr:hypothetical protein [Xanthomarina spongicola]PWK18942.1 hypothetical protein LX78_01417 [Xanthomarina spongicola]
MNRIVSIILLVILIVSCNKNDDDGNTNNQFLPNVTFDTGTLVNTSLPQYSDLQFANNFVILNNNYGINGVVLFYAGGDNYSAFELSDPNHALSGCSTLSVDGVIATCDCEDGNSYEILNGTGQTGTTGNYALKRYFVEPAGNIIRVYNN